MINFKGCQQLASSIDIIEIEANGDIWDLHNACEFVKFSNNIVDRSMSLVWDYYDYNSGELSRKIHILLSGITRIKIMPRDLNMPFYEDVCLERLVYYADNNKLMFEFRGGVVIEVICTELSFETDIVPKKES